METMLSVCDERTKLKQRERGKIREKIIEGGTREATYAMYIRLVVTV